MAIAHPADAASRLRGAVQPGRPLPEADPACRTPIANGIAALTVSVMAPYVDRQPYVGVRPFPAHEFGQFFGRAEAVTTLAGRWRRRGLSVLTGQPGSGESSLLHAKLGPEAAARGASVPPVGRPCAPPPPTLAAPPDHTPRTPALPCSWAPGTPPGRLAGPSLYELPRAE